MLSSLRGLSSLLSREEGVIEGRVRLLDIRLTLSQLGRQLNLADLLVVRDHAFVGFTIGVLESGHSSPFNVLSPAAVPRLGEFELDLVFLILELSDGGIAGKHH